MYRILRLNPGLHNSNLSLKTIVYFRKGRLAFFGNKIETRKFRKVEVGTFAELTLESKPIMNA